MKDATRRNAMRFVLLILFYFLQNARHALVRDA